MVDRKQRCETCAHYGAAEDAYIGGVYDGMRACALTLVTADGAPRDKHSGALALADPPAHTVLMTNPTFGCLMWELRRP